MLLLVERLQRQTCNVQWLITRSHGKLDLMRASREAEASCAKLKSSRKGYRDNVPYKVTRTTYGGRFSVDDCSWGRFTLHQHSLKERPSIR
uniref:Uncharacterized protein n=1 Tax=Hyaloperonospora arabidopsidis (strain Emoy2) TaxID=559515 RepID=M4B2V8_HYAAE